MTRASIYPDFEAAAQVSAPEPDAALSRQDADARSRAAYDKGYSSGWDDATAAAARRKDAVTADIERAIQDMGFTYHEAVSQVRKEFAFFVEELLKTFLPSLAAHGLREHVRAKLEEMTAPAASIDVEIFVPPRVVDKFEPFARGDGIFPISIVEEPSLADAQAIAKIGSVEWSIDFTHLIKDLDRCMTLDEEDEATEQREAVDG